MINKLPYAHIPLMNTSFIFPITGLKLEKNNKISVGMVEFADREYLKNNVVQNALFEAMSLANRYNNIETFAIVDLNKMGRYEGLCPREKGGNNSLALQILKQSIGAIYLSIYNKYKPKYDMDRRIVISDKGVHEVDEGLVDYFVLHNGKYMNYPNDTARLLIATVNDFDISNINELNNIMMKPLEERCELENKICKSLEIIYSLYSESYTVERVIKLAIILNYIFRESDKEDINIKKIERKIKILFNTVTNQNILETIPKYMLSKNCETKKIANVLDNIYSRIRNNIMHGKIDLYTEYAVISLDDYIPLKVITIEVINTILNIDDLRNCKDTKSMNSYIEKKEKEKIEKIKLEKKKGEKSKSI